MRSMRVPAMVLGVTLLAGAVGVAYQSASAADQRAQDQDQALVATAQHAAVRIADHFERAADVTLMLARDPSFHDFYTAPGSRTAKLAAGAPSAAAADDAMKYVETLFPGAVDEACFIDIATGAENGRIIRGMAMPTAALSHDEKSNVFFSHTVGLQPGYVYQSQPYKSSDTDQWVIGNATTVRVGGRPKAIVHFETTLESLRASALLNNGGVTLRVVDADQGTTLMDSRYLMSTGDSLTREGDQDFVGAVAGWQGSGELTVDGERVAYDRMTPSPTVRSVNGNLWYVVASAPVIVGGVTAAASPLALGLLALALPLLGYSLWSYVRLARRQRASAARTRAERDRLADRLEQMTDALDRAAAGDLGATLPVDLGDDAMNRLAQAFDRTLSRLRSLVGQAQDNSTRLAQAANQLRATASQQAGSATEQSAVVAETTATIEELAATAAQIAETASSVARVAQDTLHLTDDGRVAVRDSMSAMERIAGKVDFIQQSSAGLGEKINEVGRILQLIDELSEQTNLLALNAAIEAARAGEHGRGFAVVASEVRKLAERAQESTSQIQAIVTEIQHHTRSTVMASEDGFREARQGTTLAQGAVDALDRIAGMVDETTTAAEEISIATQQQRSASDQVVVAMTQVSEVSRQYTAGSKETAAAAQEISGLALQMRESIEAFNVEQGVDHGSWMSVHGGLPDDVDTARGIDGEDDELGQGRTESRAGV